LTETLHFTTAMAVAGGILLLAYGVIFSEIIHRTGAAIIGAVVMVGVGEWLGFYSQQQAVTAMDGNTLLLLAGMMMVVAMLRPTGGFEYLAIRIAKLAKGDPRRLLIYLTLAVGGLSMFLDNVTTVLIFAPLTVLITRILGLNPLPYLVAEAMISNIGGTATLVGDPPNLMIGSAANIDFLTFLLKMGPPILLVWGLTVGLLLLLFRRELVAGGGEVDLDERKAIRDGRTLQKGMLALGVMVALFFVHHHLDLYPAYVAFLGVAIAFALIRPEPEPIFGKMEWSVLVFFAGLFVLVGGVEHSGLLHLVGERLARIAREPGMLLITCLILMWVAGLLSAIVDNIPFTVTMIPIVAGLEGHGVNTTPLWWALAIGVGLGGNGSHLGATANIICMAESERAGIPEARITPLGWLRTGIPVTLTGLAASTLFFVAFFDYLAGV